MLLADAARPGFFDPPADRGGFGLPVHCAVGAMRSRWFSSTRPAWVARRGTCVIAGAASTARPAPRCEGGRAGMSGSSTLTDVLTQVDYF